MNKTTPAVYTLFLLLFLILVSLPGSSQNRKKRGKKPKYNNQYAAKSNEQLIEELSFSPLNSAAMIDRGQIELLWGNTFVKYGRMFDDEQNLSDGSANYADLYSAIQLSVGVSKSKRFNLGVDLEFMSRKFEINEELSFLSLLKVEENNPYSAKQLTAISPRLRMRPFKKSSLTYQSSFSLPLVSDSATSAFLNQNHYRWRNQLYLYSFISKSFFAFFQGEVNVNIPHSADHEFSYQTPLYVFLNYYFADMFVIYVMGNYTPIFGTASTGNDDLFINDQNFFQYGAGLQFIPGKRFLLNLFYTDIVAGKNIYDSNNFSIALRFLIN